VLVLGIAAPCVPRLSQAHSGVASRVASDDKVQIIRRANIDGMGSRSVGGRVNHLAEANESLTRARPPDHRPYLDLSSPLGRSIGVGGSVGRGRKSSVTVGAVGVTFPLSPSTSTSSPEIGSARCSVAFARTAGMVAVRSVDGAWGSGAGSPGVVFSPVVVCGEVTRASHGGRGRAPRLRGGASRPMGRCRRREAGLGS
jgi:hypothetical protein